MTYILRRMEEIIKVFGHKSPDTDTTCSAILWAWYLTNHTTTPAVPYILGEINKETQFVLNRWGVAQPELLDAVGASDTVVIVDTNNPQELFENINEAKIVGIIDHHKLVGGLSTSEPLMVILKPLASTASVIYDLLAEKNIQLPHDIAGLTLSCILSDTLEFRSPTTTPHDKAIAEKLALGLDINVSEYASEMFAAKSDVSDYTDAGLLHLDAKKFAVGEVNLTISVIETTTPEHILSRKAGIVQAIAETVKSQPDIHDVLFFVVDILQEEATVFTYNEFTKKIIEKSFEVSVLGDLTVLPGIVSRKKQIVPVLKM